MNFSSTVFFLWKDTMKNVIFIRFVVIKSYFHTVKSAKNIFFNFFFFAEVSTLLHIGEMFLLKLKILGVASMCAMWRLDLFYLLKIVIESVKVASKKIWSFKVRSLKCTPTSNFRFGNNFIRNVRLYVFQLDRS